MRLTFGEVPSPPPVEWFVMLEVAADEDGMFIDTGTTVLIRRALGGTMIRALHSPDRLAIQLQVMETDIDRAFAAGLQRWRGSAHPLLPSGWHVVRGEILTSAELERDLDSEQ